MDMLDFEKFRAQPVAAEPFPHVVVPNFVQEAALPQVIADLPAMRGRGSFPIAAVPLGPAGKALIAGLQGPAFRDATARKFGLDLNGAPVMTTLRGYSNARDGQIHTDSAAKRVTILLYLNNSAAARNGRLRLLRGPGDLEDFAVEVPPVDGTLLVFPNAANAWHGHPEFIGPRYVVQMNYMTTDSKARYEMRRHHVSAFMKRLRRGELTFI